MLKSGLLALTLGLAVTGVISYTSLPSMAQSSDTEASASKKPSAATEDFVRNAAVGNQFEIESSSIALEQARSDAVKQFAQQMIDDHTKAGKMLKDMAQRDGIAAPAEPELDSKHLEMLEKVKGAGQGTSFDRQYVEAQVTAHQEAVNLFQKYSENGDSANLKSFAKSTLPKLESHLQEITKLQRAQVGSAN